LGKRTRPDSVSTTACVGLSSAAAGSTAASGQQADQRSRDRRDVVIEKVARASVEFHRTANRI
jgi:hypothetical protein